MKTVLLFLVMFTGAFAQADINRLHSLFYSRNYTDVLTETDKYLSVNSNDAAANLFKGQALYTLGRYDEALKYLGTAERYLSADTELYASVLLYSGVSYYILNKPVKAKETLLKCAALGKKYTAVTEAKKGLLILGMDQVYDGWTKTETRNITFHFPSDSYVQVKKAFVEARQKAFENISEYFGYKQNGRIDCYVWNESMDAEKKGLPRPGFAEPKLKIIHTASDQTKGHEIAHIVIQNSIRPESTNKFLEEGTARYFDMSSTDRLEAAHIILQGFGYTGKISIKDIWQNPRSYPEAVQATVGSLLVEKLIADNENKDKFLRLLKYQTYEKAYELYGDRINNIIYELESKLSN
ncbi:MAG: tetratricopeptide repeat protein [Bacteroidota bacterium]